MRLETGFMTYKIALHVEEKSTLTVYCLISCWIKLGTEKHTGCLRIELGRRQKSWFLY